MMYLLIPILKMMINGRMKTVLYALEKMGHCSKLRLTKLLFLVSRDDNISRELKFYSFIPYKFGPYSFELYHDLQTLEREGRLGVEGNLIRVNPGPTELPRATRAVIDAKMESTLSLSDGALVDLIYDRYPEYSIFSKLKRKRAYARDRTGIMTIGYEGLSIDGFLKNLIDEKIHALVDVRDTPWSMKYGFRHYQLRKYCGDIDIEYIGRPSLGVPEEIRDELKASGDYPAFFRTYRELIRDRDEDLRYLETLSRSRRIALMCFEKEPERCHRSQLGRELIRRGAEVAIR